ncbi:MAG: hypothetical protein H6Q84_10 [Deltaproteobacteria bacterium]|nr:hypothetical protein [Deltaproteobacteria bacterium]
MRTRGSFPVVACFLLLAAGCLPSNLRLHPSGADLLKKIDVVPVESPGMFAHVSTVVPSPGGLVRLAGPHDNGILAPGSHGVLYDGAPVFVRVPEATSGGPGPAERFEKALTGPRVVWFPAVDLAEACARRLREGGKGSTAYREIVRLPGISRSEWYERDPEPVDLRLYGDRGAQAVLLVVPEMVVTGPMGTTVILRAKLADPSTGRVLARAQAEASGPGKVFPREFPAAFHSLAAAASKSALEEMGLVR